MPTQPTATAQPIKNSVIHNPDVLINHGWKVDLTRATNNPAEGKLYFAKNNHYYGFDGCRYFRGKYQVEVGGGFLVRSLIVSAQGDADCNNELAKNLFFVNKFEQHNQSVTLLAYQASLAILTPANEFDVDSFIKKANFRKMKNHSYPARKRNQLGAKKP